MASPICEERFDLPSPKRQKMETQTCDDYDSDSPKAITYNDYDSVDPYYDSDDPYQGTKEEWKRLLDECSKSQGFEIDFSKLTFWGDWQPVDLDSSWGEYETGADFMHMLANLAIADRNAKYGTSLEIGKILRANFHPSYGTTFYISFEVNDPSDGNQTKPYRAVVRHLRQDDIEVCSCDPKPSS